MRPHGRRDDGHRFPADEIGVTAAVAQVVRALLRLTGWEKRNVKGYDG